MKKLLYILVVVSAVIAGCKPALEPFSVTPTVLEFSGEAGSQDIAITAGAGWTLKVAPGNSWLSTSRTYGTSSANVTVSVTANSPTPRSAEITVSSSGQQPIVLTVNQAPGTAEVTVEKGEFYPAAASGIEVDPVCPDADKPCTIKFNPTPDNPLYGHTGELYGHFGVVVEGDWMFVPTDWATTEEKTHFKKVGDNSWEFRMEPSVREYFQSGDTPVVKIALIVRSADGEIKSHPEDQFCSVIDNKNVFVPFDPDPIVEKVMPDGVQYGINYNSDNSVTFVFYDKDTDGKSHDYCYIVGDWNNWERVSEGAMYRDHRAGCWWITLSGFDADKEYRFQYRLGNSSGTDTYVSDPYTEVVYDQWNDKYISWVPEFPEGARQLVSAFQINRPEYTWKNKNFKVEDKNDLVIYEMHFRDFSKTQNIAGAMSQLDYIQNLGVTAVELMPIQEFDGNLSWGYDPNHWFALDKQYGTREQYKEFIDECHGRGIAVIVDVVYNHATGSHPWAKMWWDAPTNCTAANNPWFNVTAKHDFNVFHDMNHENPMVKEHVKRSLEFLLEEYDVDGFRFDLTKGFTQKNTLGNTGAWGNKDDSRIAILKGYADHVWSVNDNAVVIFEHLADWSEESVLADHGIQLWRNMNGSYRSSAAGGNGDFSGSYQSGRYGGWVSYMESHDEERTMYGAVNDVTSLKWGICGTLTNWGSSPDIAMTADGAFFSAKNVTFKADDMFKIRGNNVWNDAYNYGASSKGYKLPLNSPYTLTLGAGSQDMAVPAAGTYDIYFSPDVQKVWLMTAGSARPAAPAGSGSGSASGNTEDPLAVAMRRAGANAAFFLAVPGPKMIWQFGEIGYDISIEENGRTGEKPVLTDEYVAVPARKGLYDTYAALLKFRKENPRFFDSDAEFRWYAGTSNFPGKYLFNKVDGKNMAIFANFGKGDQVISVELPHGGTWYNYFRKDEVWTGANHTPTLKEGEFVFLVDWK